VISDPNFVFLCEVENETICKLLKSLLLDKDKKFLELFHTSTFWVKNEVKLLLQASWHHFLFSSLEE